MIYSDFEKINRIVKKTYDSFFKDDKIIDIIIENKPIIKIFFDDNFTVLESNKNSNYDSIPFFVDAENLFSDAEKFVHGGLYEDENTRPTAREGNKVKMCWGGYRSAGSSGKIYVFLGNIIESAVSKFISFMQYLLHAKGIKNWRECYDDFVYFDYIVRILVNYTFSHQLFHHLSDTFNFMKSSAGESDIENTLARGFAFLNYCRLWNEADFDNKNAILLDEFLIKYLFNCYDEENCNIKKYEYVSENISSRFDFKKWADDLTDYFINRRNDQKAYKIVFDYIHNCDGYNFDVYLIYGADEFLTIIDRANYIKIWKKIGNNDAFFTDDKNIKRHNFINKKIANFIFIDIDLSFIKNKTLIYYFDRVTENATKAVQLIINKPRRKAEALKKLDELLIDSRSLKVTLSDELIDYFYKNEYLLKDYDRPIEECIYKRKGYNLFLYTLFDESYDADYVEKLIEKGADVNAFDTDGMTPLMYAAKIGNIKKSEFLLKHGANLNLYAKNNFGNALVLAVKSGNIELVDLLLNNGANVNEGGYYNITPLMLACYSKNIEIAELLIGHGADVNAINRFYDEPVIVNAIQSGCEKLVELLIAHGARSDSYVTGDTPVLVFATDRKIIRLLVAHGANINAVDRNGKNMLTMACERGNEALAEFLINEGMNVNALDCSGKTAMMQDGSWQQSYEGLFELLINHGANVNAVDDGGRSVLAYACKAAVNDKLVGLLIERGANVNAIDYEGKNIFWYACNSNNDDLVKLILKNGFNSDRIVDLKHFDAIYLECLLNMNVKVSVDFETLINECRHCYRNLTNIQTFLLTGALNS